MISVEIVVLKQAERELREVPAELKSDVFALFEDLMAGKKLAMPISRPLPSIAKGLHELRLSSRGGEFRVFYAIKVGDAIYILLALQKKTQGLDKHTLGILKTRLRSIGL